MKAEEIARGNDLLRIALIVGGRTVITRGVDGALDREKIINAAQSFTNFNHDNDPYKEHDFGKFEVSGQSYFFKIDYYDKNYHYGIDPYSGEDFQRVLTIMHSSEY